MKEHSERVPNKNIKDFCGKPLFYYILNTLSGSKYIDEIMREKYDLTDEEVVQGKRFLLMLLERKRLSKNNDLEYDKEKGLINNIDFIMFNKSNRKFLVNKDKINSSLSNKSKTNTSKSKTKKIKEKGSKEN